MYIGFSLRWKDFFKKFRKFSILIGLEVYNGIYYSTCYINTQISLLNFSSLLVHNSKDWIPGKFSPTEK